MAKVTVTIKSEGVVINPTHQFISIDSSKEFNKLPIAELKMSDGKKSEQKFELLDDDLFLPGKEVEVFIRNEGSFDADVKIFSGIVVNHELEWTDKYGSVLTVELYDKAVKMTGVRKNVVYKNKKDSQVINSLISQNKLKAGTIATTKQQHLEMVQYYASDWDFMLSRAEANAQFIVVNDGEISTIQPKVGASSLVLDFGIDFFNFDLRLDGFNLYGDVTSSAWDLKNQKLSSKKGEKYKLDHKYSVSSIASVMGTEKADLIHSAPIAPAEIQSWADAQTMKSRLAMLCGTIKLTGNGKIQVGQTLELQNVSRFSGKHIITGVRHTYSVGVGSWYTYVQVGRDADWFTDQPKVMDAPAAGLLPGVNGLQIGVVESHKKDPDNQFRVRVSVPSLGAGQPGKGTIWARLASLDAGAGHGVYFHPQKGDEVVVGFLNDDPRQAIILGAMFSQANKVPPQVKDELNQKGIFTEKYQLLFDEKKEIITLSTSDNHKVAIDEKQKSISLEDNNGNKIELGKKGLTIISAKDCQIQTDGNLKIAASGNVEIKGKEVTLV